MRISIFLTQEFCIVRRLDVILVDPLVNVVPDLEDLGLGGPQRDKSHLGLRGVDLVDQ